MSPNSETVFSKVFAVDYAYTRAINIVRDKDAEAFLKIYKPTSLALDLAQQIFNTIFQKTPCNKAWLVVGPYGTGKSSLALFLSRVLDVKDQRIASVIEAGEDKKRIQALRRDSKICTARLTGSHQFLAPKLLLAVCQEALIWCGEKRIQSIQHIKAAIEKQNIDQDSVMAMLEEVLSVLYKAGCDSLCLFVDELGRHFEYAAEKRDFRDIHLLQMLAERAVVSTGTRLLFFGVQHHGVDYYARNVGTDQQKEWSKVAERFETLRVRYSPGESLHILSRCIRNKMRPLTEKTIQKSVVRVLNSVKKASPEAHRILKSIGIDTLCRCYPLHPVTGLALVYMSEMAGQNERTMFGWLNSKGSDGFVGSCRDLREVGRDWILPHCLFDHFFYAHGGMHLPQVARRKYAEIISIYDRLDAGNDRNLIQTYQAIGVLNFVDNRGGLLASQGLIKVVSRNGSSAKGYLNALIQKSILIYRKHRDEYCIWRGSDYDIDASIQAATKEVAQQSVAQLINHIKFIGPIVGRRHYIETGAMRGVEVRFLDRMMIEQKDHSNTESLSVFIMLRCSGALSVRGEASEQEDLIKLAKSISNKGNACCVPPSDRNILSLAIEVLALRRILDNDSSLRQDPPAKNEINRRLNGAEQSLQATIEQILRNEDNKVIWIVNKRKRVKLNAQYVVSNLLDETYSKSPKIISELVNKDRVSPTITYARKSLFSALLAHEDKKALGIDHHPPERMIYECVFRRSGLHIKHNESWRMNVSGILRSRRDPCRLRPAIEKIMDYFCSNEGKEEPLLELDNTLSAPPYGVKAGVRPILYFACYIANRNNVAVYEDGIFVPHFHSAHVARFLARPTAFSFSYIKLDSAPKAILAGYWELFSKEGAKKKSLDANGLISLAGPLASWHRNLPTYAKKTECLSSKALSFRNCIYTSKSPANLFLKDIPDAFGYALEKLFHSEKERTRFFSDMRKAISEINKCAKRLHLRFENLLCGLTGMTSLPRARIAIKTWLTEIEKHGLIVGLIKDPDILVIYNAIRAKAEDQQWLAQFLAQMAGSSGPLSEWNDSEAASVELRIRDTLLKLREIHQVLDMTEESMENVRVLTDDDPRVVAVLDCIKGEEESRQATLLLAALRKFSRNLDEAHAGGMK